MKKFYKLITSKYIFLIVTMSICSITCSAQAVNQQKLNKAKAGNADAMLSVAYQYEIAYDKDGNIDNLKKAEYWLKKVGHRLNFEGILELATLYDTRFKDKEKGMATLMEASNAGCAQATYRIASTYQYGWYGPKDPSKCLTWYLKAQQQGYNCKQQIATCYIEGIGTEKNTAKGFQILAKDAIKGRQYAIKELSQYGYGKTDYSRLANANTSNNNGYRRSSNTGNSSSATYSSNASSSQTRQLPNSGDFYFLGYHLLIMNGGASGSWLYTSTGGAWPVRYVGFSNDRFNFVWTYTYTDFNAGYPYPIKKIEHPFSVAADFSNLKDEHGSTFRRSTKQSYNNIYNDTQRLIKGGGGNNGNSSNGSTTKNSSTGSIVCKYCGGRGTCSSCKGRGYKFNNYSGHNDTCPGCNGSGRCFNCHGSGRQR